MPEIEKFLTPRLMMIADLVPPSSTVCDIGTDHGYIAIYLAKKGIAKSVIMISDFSKNISVASVLICLSPEMIRVIHYKTHSLRGVFFILNSKSIHNISHLKIDKSNLLC